MRGRRRHSDLLRFLVHIFVDRTNFELQRSFYHIGLSLLLTLIETSTYLNRKWQTKKNANSDRWFFEKISLTHFSIYSRIFIFSLHGVQYASIQSKGKRSFYIFAVIWFIARFLARLALNCECIQLTTMMLRCVQNLFE